jgi:hypothetical protein
MNYSDLPLDIKYISVIRLYYTACGATDAGINSPWHMDAIGEMYFCDISGLHQNFTSLLRSLLCDRMEQMMEQTGENGFHYVDEAAPPALMRVGMILQKKLSVTWWTNIRFEKVFLEICVYY